MSTLYKSVIAILLYTAGIMVFGCTRNHPSDPPPEEKQVKLLPLNHLISGELMKDSLWEDNVSHTLYINEGLKFTAPSVNIYPGAILSIRDFSKVNNIDLLPVALSSREYSSEYLPSYETFNSILSEYKQKNRGNASQVYSDDGREFSKYGDLVLVNGYNTRSVESWLNISSDPKALKKNSIVFLFKTVDFSIITELPKINQLIDRSKYISEIEADSMVYVNQVNIGKTALLTVSCDISPEEIRAMITKIRNKRTLTNTEQESLNKAEIGYSLAGFEKSKIIYSNNLNLLERFFDTIVSVNTTGVPIEFFLRKIKDLSPLINIQKVDVIRK